MAEPLHLFSGEKPTGWRAGHVIAPVFFQIGIEVLSLDRFPDCHPGNPSLPT